MWHHSKAQAVPGTAGNPQNVPDRVLAAYGWPLQRIQVLPAQSGFSGALVWKVTVQERSFALKRWPVDQPVYLNLRIIHQLMQQANQAGLLVIPGILQTTEGQSELIHGGLRWDACTWQPGQSDSDPDQARLRSALTLLSRLHAIWRSQNARRFEVCPAVRLQHRRLVEWSGDELEQLKRKAMANGGFGEAVHLFQQLRPRAIQHLAPWLNRRVSLQPCLGDIWADHVLFEGDQVTGLIDFGGVRYDHPSQDLARLIGSYSQGNSSRRQLALSCYATLTTEAEELAMVLDDCGTIVGLSNWLRWLLLEERRFADDTAAFNRLKMILKRFSQLT